MSSTRKSRFGNAFAQGAEAAAATKDPYPVEDRPSAGNWSRQAFNALTADVEEAQAEAAKANSIQHQGILEGSIPVRIPADMIKDVIGTDRVAAGEEDESGNSYSSLLENIRTRGLKTPIRVRPIDTEWRPNPAFPRDVTGQRFALQSGRRRLQACKELGIEPLCFMSFSQDGNTRYDDLTERFFENTARKDLTMAEKLHSIGLIAKETEATTQAQIAEILGVNVSYVNRGISLVENFDALKELLPDLHKAGLNAIEAALKQINDAKDQLSVSPEAVRKRQERQRSSNTPPLPFKARETPLGTLKLKKTRSGGRSMTIESDALDDEKIEKIASFIESLS